MIFIKDEHIIETILADERRTLAPLKWSRWSAGRGSHAGHKRLGIKWYDILDMGGGEFGLYIVTRMETDDVFQNDWTFVERFATLSAARKYADQTRPFIVAVTS